MPFSCKKTAAMPQSVRLHFAALIKRVPGFQPADDKRKPRQRFCAYRIATSFSRQNYGGRTGPTSVRPGSLLPVVENPSNVSPPTVSQLWMVSFQYLRAKEATPWQNRKQHRAIAARRHIQTEINRRLSRAFRRVAKIMHINMLHERSCELSNLYSSAVFSYLADDLRELQQLIQQQNKPSINSCSGPFLHLAAGGLRTSVVKRIAA